MISNKKHIIFDWNGTLIDDTNIFVDVLNVLLSRRKLDKINLQIYRDLFCFPIIDFYKKIGLDVSRDAFSQLKKEFVAEYKKRQYVAKLFPQSIDVLKKILENNISLSLLSASHQSTLNNLTKFYSIDGFFQHIVGVNNYIANGKIQQGVQLLGDLKFKKSELLLIGDTILDYDVSRALGVDCVLISHGHQSIEQLQDCNNIIIQSFDMLFE